MVYFAAEVGSCVRELDSWLMTGTRSPATRIDTFPPSARDGEVRSPRAPPMAANGPETVTVTILI